MDVLIFDPFSRLHDQDENSNGEMGIIWNNIVLIMRKNPGLSVFLIHHFGKDGDIANGFDAFRGHSRAGAEADLGILFQNIPSTKDKGVHIRFVGRSLRGLEPKDGGDFFTTSLDNGGKLLIDDGVGKGGGHSPSQGPRQPKPKPKGLYDEIKERGGEWAVSEIAEYYHISEKDALKMIQDINGKGKPKIDVSRDKKAVIVDGII